MENLDTWIYLPESEDLPWLESELGERWKQPNLLKLIPTPKPSLDTTGPTSRFTPTSEPITEVPDNSTSSPLDSPAPEPPSPEPAPDWSTPNQPCLGMPCESLPPSDPDTPSSSNPWELSIAALEQCLADYIWLDIVAKLKQSTPHHWGPGIEGGDYLLFPTPTANLGTYREAGQNKLEQWFRDHGLIPPGSQLSAQAYAVIMGYPPNWFQALTPINSLAPPEPPEDLKHENLQADPSHHNRQQSQSKESYTCIPTRRPKGFGGGRIEARPTTQRGKVYEQFYYHWEIDGEKRSKYIPKGQLEKIRELDRAKASIAEILREIQGG